jgi:hypothetical protein
LGEINQIIKIAGINAVGEAGLDLRSDRGIQKLDPAVQTVNVAQRAVEESVVENDGADGG